MTEQEIPTQNLQPYHSLSLKELPASRNFLSYKSFFLMKKLSELKPGCTAETVLGCQGLQNLLLSQYLLFSTEVRKDFPDFCSVDLDTFLDKRLEQSRGLREGNTVCRGRDVSVHRCVNISEHKYNQKLDLLAQAIIPLNQVSQEAHKFKASLSTE